MFLTKKFDDHVKEMKSFGEILIPHNRPKVSLEDEQDINYIKSREVMVDGYNVVVYYSISERDSHFLEVIQITGRYTPFLPFSIICKIGRKFLGDKYLSYMDFVKDGRKVYCWTVATDTNHKSIPAIYKEGIMSDDCFYEGLCYKCINSPKEI
jgi:hypothetical protein